MTEPLGVGVVGLGMFGTLHCRAVAEHRRMRLVSVLDVNPSVSEDVAERWGARSAHDLDDLVSDPDVHAIIVCTPEDRHVEPVRAALEAGKHVLVEKPLTTDSSSAAELARLATKMERLLLVGHILRFDPRYTCAQEAASSGRLGTVRHVWARRNNPRTAARRVSGRVPLVYYLGIHDIDAALWITGQAPKSVFARATTGVNQDLGVEDGYFALLRLDGGSVVSLESSWSLPEQMGTRVYGGLEVVGDAGMVTIDTGSSGLVEIGVHGRNTIDPHVWPVVHGRLEGDLVREIDHFASCILDGTEPIIAPEAAITAVRVAEAILESSRTEEVVYL